jgi:hypothetical protein
MQTHPLFWTNKTTHREWCNVKTGTAEDMIYGSPFPWHPQTCPEAMLFPWGVLLSTSFFFGGGGEEQFIVFIIVLSGGTLWHPQKFLQHNKHTMLEFTWGPASWSYNSHYHSIHLFKANNSMVSIYLPSCETIITNFFIPKKKTLPIIDWMFYGHPQILLLKPYSPLGDN